MSTSQTQHKCFHIFYTKDINKKKKIYKEGVLLVSSNNVAKIFDEDGQMVISFKNKEKSIIPIQVLLEYSRIVTVDKKGNIDEYNTGAIFTKKQMTVLPIKKKQMVGLNAESKNKIQNLVLMDCGLRIQKKLYDILRPHQRQGVQFMYKCVSGKKNNALNGCILADFMGLGKTLQTLALVYSMVKQKQIKKFVIVCPLTLLDVWQKQTKKWLNQWIIPLICYGDGAQTTNIVRNFVSQQYRMLIISYETFYKNIEKISGKCDMIIFDEGHRMKNKKSKLLLKMKVFKCEKRILLTGTPIQNNLEQLYTCISIINPRMFGSEAIFKNVFQKPILEGLGKKATPEQKTIAKQRTNQLARQLKQFSLRRTADILKKFLPPKNQHLIFMQLTPLQQLWYKRIVENMKQNEDDMFRSLNYLRKLFIHPSILKMKKINNGDFLNCLQECQDQISPKIQFTLKVLENCVRNEEKCVVVSYYTETLDFIGSILKQRGIDYAKLDGRLKGQQRKIAIKKFQSQAPVLLLSGKAGGTGLTLICAVKMIMIEPDWNPSNDSQVMGRIWRQGQTKQVHIYRLLIASTFEEKMLQRQGLKKTLANNLIDNTEGQGCGIDFQNLGKLFINYETRVLTYKEKQNQIQEFQQQHPQYFHSNQSQQHKISNGIIFAKTIKSTNEQLNSKNESQENNEFNNLQLENFVENKEENCKKQRKGQEDENLDGQQEQQDEGDSQQEQMNKIGKIQKITIKNKGNKQENIQMQVEPTKKPEKQKDFPIKNFYKKQYENQTQIQENQPEQRQTHLNFRKEQQQINKKSERQREIEKIKQLQHKFCSQNNANDDEQNILLSRKNMKIQCTPFGPSNILKKIKKK